jgi:hypothetical protein
MKIERGKWGNGEMGGICVCSCENRNSDSSKPFDGHVDCSKAPTLKLRSCLHFHLYVSVLIIICIVKIRIFRTNGSFE